MKKSCYKDLKVWQKSVQLTMDIYKLTQKFPQSEQFGLTNQMRRAAVSIPSNIAEGHGRNSDSDFVRFLFIAKGSLNELETQIILACELGFTSYMECGSLMLMIDELGKMLRSLIERLKNVVE